VARVGQSAAIAGSRIGSTPARSPGSSRKSGHAAVFVRREVGGGFRPAAGAGGNAFCRPARTALHARMTRTDERTEPGRPDPTAVTPAPISFDDARDIVAERRAVGCARVGGCEYLTGRYGQRPAAERARTRGACCRDRKGSRELPGSRNCTPRMV